MALIGQELIPQKTQADAFKGMRIDPQKPAELTPHQQIVLKAISNEFDRKNQQGGLEGIGPNQKTRLSLDQVDIFLLKEIFPSQTGNTDVWVVLPKESSVSDYHLDKRVQSTNSAKLIVAVSKDGKESEFIAMESALQEIHTYDGEVLGPGRDFPRKAFITFSKSDYTKPGTISFKSFFTSGEPQRKDEIFSHSNLAGFVLFPSDFSLYRKGEIGQDVHPYSGIVVKKQI